MASASDDASAKFISEFELWQERTASEIIFLLETKYLGDGLVQLHLLMAGEYEFRLDLPSGSALHNSGISLEADPAIRKWSSALKEYLSQESNSLSLSQVLDMAVELYSLNGIHRKSISEDDVTEEDEEMDDFDDHLVMSLSDEDDASFTTEWELTMARRKKRWVQKEVEIREKLKKDKLGPYQSDLALHATGQEKEMARQIFTSSAASGILTNDLVRIMENQKVIGLTADPVDDNIYQWCVKLFDFLPESELSADLEDIQAKYDYNYIELQLDFAIDLYPFYPPLVKVIRPLLQGSMMQRVTNMEMLKLSYWNPAKDMKGVLSDIKVFLQQWARLEVNSERNDRKRFPFGSYVDIEHHLLRLALVSEVNPRANIKYHLDVERPPDMRPNPLPPASPPNPRQDGKNGGGGKKKDQYWAAGTGYGHHNRPEWDMTAYIAAQKEKDKQIEMVLHKILQELKKLYANHAPQLKPRSRNTGDSPPGGACAGDTVPTESVDPVEDMFNILEGSALVPFLESYLRADSFLEICRHTPVYKVIVDVIKEIALQPQLVPLLCLLTDQPSSIYQLLSTLEQKACALLQHICKAGNGSIPKPPKKEHNIFSKKGRERPAYQLENMAGMADVQASYSAEEKLAREFQGLFKDVSDALKRLGLDPEKQPENPSLDSEVMEINIVTDELAVLEARYKKVMECLQFLAMDVDLEGASTHHYVKEFKKQDTMASPSQALVFRIAQELTSLSTSLPLNLSSGIFVRTDDDKLTLMKALITGPEGTPYSGGCFHFDIYFQGNYPRVPPMVNLQTTGGGIVRFNPNLYNCGKVCLSLLGTWEGQQGEQWNETTSTLLQVLVSIQSLILVPEPYFNEPGYEQEIGTEPGRRHSNDYNLDVQINTIKYAMIGQLQNPSHGFEDVIKAHFYLKKERILQEVEDWVQTSKSSKLERAYQNLRQELQKLDPPPNVANLFQQQFAVTKKQLFTQEISFKMIFLFCFQLRAFTEMSRYALSSLLPSMACNRNLQCARPMPMKPTKASLKASSSQLS
ncbi:hypothetical protein CAPTEDRAFT_195632 [Capitella teleta]|uniref:UBC core domain-containing protein n=1 Tax=Capitella teleta TaxID=283909 RepID=R7VKA5_CAPTE|nr:hypothetical protein CAPTEDRAFT_195632 [Capitella teleta]|eukprot:ELU17166.1 hypothetical protein CAPTEDRAFT_195632 [Capitella teleta]